VKKLTLVTLILSGFALSAQAQSTVTVYGIVDLGLVKSTGETTIERENRSSRLGFKGSEDLGGGLSALFQLETEILADTGQQQGVLFNRQSWVGLKGTFGSVALGRTKNLIDGATSRIDPFYTDGVIGKINERILRGGVGSSRVNNAITYNSPKVNGFVGNAQYVLSEVSGADAGYGLLLTYDEGALNLHGGYSRAVQSAPSEAEPNLWIVGGGYKFGDAKVTASYARGDTESSSRGKYNAFVIGLNYKIGKGVILASIGRQEQSNAVADDAATLKEYGLGYAYNLSKRTSLYAYVGSERVSEVTSYQVGITHNF
jgi:predicted porin